MLLPFTAVHAATVKSVAVEPAGADVRVTVQLSDRFDAPTAFAMTGPMRIVVDLPGNRTETRSIDGQGGVTRARLAQYKAETARLVVDLGAPMTLGNSEAKQAGDGATLSFLLQPADEAGFNRFVAKGRAKLKGIDAPAAPAPQPAAIAQAPAPASAAPKEAEPAPAKSIAEAATSLLIPSAAAATAPEPKPASRAVASRSRAAYRPLVVIDAGHGGKDVGAISALEGRYEKDVTLAIARAIERELEESGRVRVLLTRSDDRFLPLPQRVAIARNHKAHLFISVHADSAPSPDVRGATVYTLSEVASDKEAARLAAKENKSDVLAGINLASENADVSDILLDLAQRETMNTSAEFAATLQREMRPKVHFKSNFHRFAGFRVLKAPDVPSVLLETGYISNIEDSKFLFSKAGQKAIAEGVRRAVEAHFMRRMAQR